MSSKKRRPSKRTPTARGGYTNIRRIRIRGEQRKHPDVALVAQAVMQLGREMYMREQAEKAEQESKNDKL